MGSRALGELDKAFGAIENCFDWTKKYSQGIAPPINNPYRVDEILIQEAPKLDLSCAFEKAVYKPPVVNSSKPFDYTLQFAANDLDSRAWEDRDRNFMDKAKDVWNDFKDSHLGQAGKEALLSGGCAAAGDLQGALEHGVECLKELWESEMERGLWQRPGDGR